jgi:hypothetical protein
MNLTVNVSWAHQLAVANSGPRPQKRRPTLVQPVSTLEDAVVGRAELQDVASQPNLLCSPVATLMCPGVACTVMLGAGARHRLRRHRYAMPCPRSRLFLLRPD